MAEGLERRQEKGDLHFVTFSCFHRCGYLKNPAAGDLFEEALARMCHCHQFDVFGYVVMPEHVHMLLGTRQGFARSRFAGIEDFRVEASQGAPILAGALL